MRKLKFHEQKLLKKTNFLQWKTDNHRELEVPLEGGSFGQHTHTHAVHTHVNHPSLQVLRRYHISDRDDYKKYNKLCGHITKLVSQLRQLDDKDPTRIELTDKLLDKYAGAFLCFFSSCVGLTCIGKHTPCMSYTHTLSCCATMPTVLHTSTRIAPCSASPM